MGELHYIPLPQQFTSILTDTSYLNNLWLNTWINIYTHKPCFRKIAVADLTSGFLANLNKQPPFHGVFASSSRKNSPRNVYRNSFCTSAKVIPATAYSSCSSAFTFGKARSSSATASGGKPSLYQSLNRWSTPITSYLVILSAR